MMNTFTKSIDDLSRKYWVWSFEHKAWWKPSWLGYTEDMSEAGIYSFAEAHGIVGQANERGRVNEALVPVPFTHGECKRFGKLP